MEAPTLQRIFESVVEMGVWDNKEFFLLRLWYFQEVDYYE